VDTPGRSRYDAPVCAGTASGRQRSRAPMSDDALRGRLAVDFPVTLESVPGAVRVTGTVINISLGGMFVASASLLPAGTPLWISCALPLAAGPAPFDAGGWVHWVHDPPGGAAPGRPRGMGIQFLNLPPDARARLEAFLAELRGKGA
jgi:uncharacterized protein (TIGR02266 family)